MTSSHPIRDWVLLAALTVFTNSRYLPIAPAWHAFFLPLLLLGTLLHPGWLISRILEAAPIRWIGRLSYSLYIWQQLFLTHDAFHPLGAVQEFPWNIFLAFVCAILSYRFIEQPVLRLGHRISARITA